MLQTILLRTLLEKAEDIRKEFNSEQLGATHILAAMVDLCQTEYSGFSLSDTTLHPSPFEEERLRYIREKEIKLAAFFRLTLAKNNRNGVTEAAFNFDGCEQVAAARGAALLSSDVVFLCALQTFQQENRAVTRTPLTDESILSILEEIDRNIFDYVVDKVEVLREKLKEKANTAVAIRDWLPAAKFADPDEVLTRLFAKIKMDVSDNVVTLKLLRFFGVTDLKLSIHTVNGAYYISDNGCAVKHLTKRVRDKEKRNRVLNKVCHPCWLYQDAVTGCFSSTFSFFEYMKWLVFVAHADLYYTKAEGRLCKKEKDYVYLTAEKGEPMDTTALLSLLRGGIGCYYDENDGLCVWADAKCSLSSSRTAVQIKTLPSGDICLSDKRKSQYEGTILEAFYWDHDDIAPYGTFITKLTARFGAAFDGKDVYLTEKAERFDKALFRFFNLAVLLAELDHNITLPKVREKAKTHK